MINFILALSLIVTAQFSQNASNVRVLFLGDSITAGYGLKPEQSYPEQVAQILRKDNIFITAVNGGVSGDTTAGGVRRLDWQLKSNPDLVVIALGGNDMLRGLPPEASKKNISTMIQKLQQRRIPVVLLGMKASPSLGKEYATEFNAIYRDLGKEFGIPVLEFFIEKVALKPEFNLRDRIHPNIEGQKMIAQDVAEFLKPVLRGLSKKKEAMKDDQNSEAL